MNTSDEQSFWDFAWRSNKTEITIDAVELVIFSLSVVSLPFYIAFILFLFKNHKVKPFDGQFFTISISEGISDLILLSLTYICFKLPAWAWVEPEFYLHLPPWVSKLAICLTFRASFAQMLGVALLSFNRFTRLVWPHKYEKLCSGRMLRVYLAIQWIIPWTLVVPMLWQEFRFKRNDLTIGVHISWLNPLYETRYIALTGVYSIVCNLASALMYFIIFVNHCLSKQMKVRPECSTETAVQMPPKVEVQLAIAGLLIYMVMLSNSISIIKNALQGNELLSNVLSDAVCYCNPYFICLMSKEVRRKLKYFVLCMGDVAYDNMDKKKDVGTRQNSVALQNDHSSADGANDAI